MKKTRKQSGSRSKPGDFFEVSLDNGTHAYLQYVGKHETGLDVVQILNGDGKQVADLAQIAALPRAYALCTFVTYLRRLTAFRYLGSQSTVPPMPEFRESALIGWKLPSGEIVEALDDKSAALSILEGLSADIVLKRLNDKWRPEFDRSDLLSKLRLHKRSNSVVRTLFLLFKNSQKAREAAVMLMAQGYEAARNGKQVEIKWTMSAAEFAEGRKLQGVEEKVLELCRPFGGTYSGNEVEPT